MCAERKLNPALPMSNAAIDEALKAWDELDGCGDACTYLSHRCLEADRLQVFQTAFSCLRGVAEGDVVAIVARSADGVIKEIVAHPSGDPRKLTPVTISCQITFVDLSPSECIEYQLRETEQWMMAQLSQEALETYRGMKFQAWLNMLKNPTCEAQFRRMLQLGPVTQMYDPHVFPTPDSLKCRYEVTDDRTGKLIRLPHPLKSIRIWDANVGVYTYIDPQLDGAPPEAEKNAWWSDLIKELQTAHGEEYISEIIKQGFI